ncbi:TetR/AcrR family transcriptional regulator [Aquipuribacter nitratireducens]|uniref:TetR/AcrR family transcriptional regulator n=1 Tax=Aquipuribacter nitratireducens TaxID=650104 RepID=A0ABW0GQ51_9MICO
MPEDRRAQATRIARRILDEEGWDAITMRRLADEMGIRAPSLYKHVRDKDELRSALIAQGLAELGGSMAEAGPDLARLAAAYRAWAVASPHLYQLATYGPLDRSRLPAGLEDEAAAPLYEALGTEHRARAAWAAAHGLAVLEITGRFPEDADLDAAWQAMVEAFTGAVGRNGPRAS